MLTKQKKISTSAGVYIFRRRNTPLYIGKALNLKKRLASYFRKRANLPAKIQMMLNEADWLEIIKTASEIEALLKEAELIKRYRPKYNALMRDDKSYFYVAVAREKFPRIFATHQPRSSKRIAYSGKRIARTKRQLSAERYPLSARYIGPFTSGTALKQTLKLLRRIFPYCTCKKPHKRLCLNSEMGRCLGDCCIIAESKKEKVKSKKVREYRKNIRNIIAVLNGKKTQLVTQLKQQMKDAAGHERYEESGRLRDAIFGLEDIFAHRKVLHAPEMRQAWPAVQAKLQVLLKTNRLISRIEGYDVSNISGREATGSMVVFANGQPDKSQYRKFRIKMPAPPGGGSDVNMLKEILQRRFKHSEWPYPDLMIIDGGKPQLGAALKALREIRSKKSEVRGVIVSALAKGEEILFLENGRSIALKRWEPVILHLFQRIRDESHRFARRYHHKLREKYFATSTKPQKINYP